MTQSYAIRTFGTFDLQLQSLEKDAKLTLRVKNAFLKELRDREMNEDLWRLTQLGMWALGLQTAFLGAIALFIWNNISKRCDAIESTLTKRCDDIESALTKRCDAIEGTIKSEVKRLEDKIDGLGAKMTSLELRVTVVETKLSDVSTNVSLLMWHNQLPRLESQRKVENG